MFPGSFNLQGGTGISLNPKPVQTPTKTQLQPAVNPMSYNSVPISTGNYSNAQTLAANTSAPPPAAAPAPPPPDPYAQWGGQAHYNALTGQFDSSANALRNSATDWGNNYAIGLGGSVTDYLNSTRQGQQALDERGVQAELARKQAYNGILGMVGRGIQSGGVMLAGRNAGDSSAAEAIARAYGNLGQRQMNDVGNQYAQTERGIGIDQGNFNIQKTSSARKITDQEQMSLNQTLSDAKQRIADLNNWAAIQSLPNRLDANAEASQLQAQISGILGKYGDQLNSGVAGINPASTDQNRVAASNLALAGTSASNPFDFQASAPAQFNNTGVSPGSLPIYTTPRKKTA